MPSAGKQQIAPTKEETKEKPSRSYAPGGFKKREKNSRQCVLPKRKKNFSIMCRILIML